MSDSPSSSILSTWRGLLAVPQGRAPASGSNGILGRLTRLLGPWSPEVVFLSVAKSGRTWHRVMLGAYLASASGKSPERALRLRELCKATGARSATYSHNGASTHRLPFTSTKVGDVSEWSGKHVMLIVRDPRDILVSGYHHAHFRRQTFAGSISEFVRDPTTGVEKILTAWHRWNDARARAASFLVTSYELMHAKPHHVLRDTIALLGLLPQDDLIEAAVDFSAFDKMKAYEQTDLFRNSIMRNQRQRPESAKVRQGKIGEFKQHLSENDLAFIEAKIAALGDPFEAYHRQPRTRGLAIEAADAGGSGTEGTCAP